MVLESTMICVDSSEFMRNGDYFPSRLEAERDAVNLIVQCKLRANAENTVGLLAMTDEVLSTLTQDNGRIFMKLHQLTPKGECQPMTAIRVAHLALKHRQNRNHRTRIVVFIGSPIRNDIQEFIATAKKLKKEKVNVDIISFGVGDVNSEKLKAFVDTLNGKDGTGQYIHFNLMMVLIFLLSRSHLVVVPPGSSLQESLLTSAIIRGDGDESSSIPSINAAGFAFGVDPNEDPELAMALRVSLEEQRQRQELDARQQNLEPMDADMPKDQVESSESADSKGNEDCEIVMALQMSLEGDANKGTKEESGGTAEHCPSPAGTETRGEDGQSASDVSEAKSGKKDAPSSATIDKKSAESKQKENSENDAEEASFKTEITPLTEEDEQLLIALQLSLDEARRNIEESQKKNTADDQAAQGDQPNLPRKDEVKQVSDNASTSVQKEEDTGVRNVDDPKSGATKATTTGVVIADARALDKLISGLPGIAKEIKETKKPSKPEAKKKSGENSASKKDETQGKK
ncbi:hypothetical protein M513_00873 [Trichuris suis]|uniref:26S proteasome non-ATPase regulatory subunit 4 n=1 Tax=Trichuris suis TaxID=68888 RepID=A0A085MLL4_9BILA|nr:hypothetical protein M513_00873 [Trichuris suis]